MGRANRSVVDDRRVGAEGALRLGCEKTLNFWVCGAQMSGLGGAGGSDSGSDNEYYVNYFSGLT